VAGYSGYRIFEETIRIDSSEHILGMRLNFWIALILCLIGLAWFVQAQRSAKHSADDVAGGLTADDDGEAGEPAISDDAAPDVASPSGTAPDEAAAEQTAEPGRAETKADEVAAEPATPRAPD
jgi:hypothetical protein